MSQRTVLFVDDETEILDGLSSILRRDRRRWNLLFANSVGCALDHVRSTRVDAIVTDMQMPEMDGAQLLSLVRDESPFTARLMLTAESDYTVIIRAFPFVHQLLGKPCAVATLRATIEETLACDSIRDERLLARIRGLDHLPMLRVDLDEARSASGPAGLTALLERSPALAAKVLQIVGSNYFGGGDKTVSIARAASMLGSDGFRRLAESVPTHSVFDGDSPYGISLEALQARSERTARLVAKFVPAQEGACAAGLLHEVGKLALAAASPESGDGVGHADVGAHLLALWGLPSSIGDAVRFQHAPDRAPEAARLLASAVHVANAVTTGDDIDSASLASAGTVQHLAQWHAIAGSAAG